MTELILDCALDALKDGFDVIEVREENDWVAILAKVR